MTTWTKLSRSKGRAGTGRVKRQTPAVRRNAKTACLVIPCSQTDATRADIFSDGNGKLGFMFSDSGEYALRKSNKYAQTVQITIPVKFAPRIPLGTTEANLTNDGPVTVLDLSQFEAAEAR